MSTKWGLLCAGLLRASDKERRARADDVERALGTVSLKLRASAGERDAATEALRRADTEIARLVRALDALRMDHDDALRRLAHERGLRGELGMLARGRTFRNRWRRFGVSGRAVCFGDAAGDGRAVRRDDRRGGAREGRGGGRADGVGRERRAGQAGRDPARVSRRAAGHGGRGRARRGWRGPSANAPPSGAAEPTPPSSARRDAQNAATAMDAATRRVQRRALEVKAELIAALLDGLAARRDAVVANRLAGASAEKTSAYRAENAAARVMRFARLSKERRIREGSLPGTPTKDTAATNEDTANTTSRLEKEDGRVETASDRFGSAASMMSTRARALGDGVGARAISARTERLLQTGTPLQTARTATRRRTRKQSPKNALRTPRFVRKTSRFGSPSPPARMRFRTPTRSPRREPRGARAKVVHSPPAKAHALRETVVARGGGVSFDEDPADRSYASLVKARARARGRARGAERERRGARGARAAVRRGSGRRAGRGRAATRECRRRKKREEVDAAALGRAASAQVGQEKSGRDQSVRLQTDQGEGHEAVSARRREAVSARRRSNRSSSM